MNSNNNKNDFHLYQQQQHHCHSHEEQQPKVQLQRMPSSVLRLDTKGTLLFGPTRELVDVGFLPGNSSATTVIQDSYNNNHDSSSLHVYDQPPDNSKKRPRPHSPCCTKKRKTIENLALFPPLDSPDSLCFDVDFSTTTTSKVLDDDMVFHEFSMFTDFPLSPPLSPADVGDLDLFP